MVWYGLSYYYLTVLLVPVLLLLSSNNKIIRTIPFQTSTSNNKNRMLQHPLLLLRKQLRLLQLVFTVVVVVVVNMSSRIISTTTTNVVFVAVVEGREIPTKKAIPPLMDPIPILPEITHRIYMDITIGGDKDEEEGEESDDDKQNDENANKQRTGRIVIGLFGKNAPTAAENFRLLATCTNTFMMTDNVPTVTTSTQRRISTASTATNTATTNTQPQSTESTTKNILCYKDTIFHRILPYFALQGGDTTHGNGIGGRAAIRNNNNHNNKNHDHMDGTYQPFMINTTQFNRPYMVAVATPNTQLAKSQFFITTVKAQWLSELQYTILGMVLEGRDYIHIIEQMAGTYGGRPKVTVRIVDCGEMPLQPYDIEPHY